MFCMVIDTGPNFYVVLSTSQYVTLRLIIFVLQSCVKVFTVSVFANPLMDLIHVWHGDRNMSKIFAVPSLPQDMTYRSRSQT